MKSSLGWSLTQSGWLNTANAIGYILGSILTLFLIRHVSPSRLFAGGTVATALCLLLTGFNESLVFQTACRTLVGLFGALSFVSGGVLAASLFQDIAPVGMHWPSPCTLAAAVGWVSRYAVQPFRPCWTYSALNRGTGRGSGLD